MVQGFGDRHFQRQAQHPGRQGLEGLAGPALGKLFQEGRLGPQSPFDGLIGRHRAQVIEVQAQKPVRGLGQGVEGVAGFPLPLDPTPFRII